MRALLRAAPWMLGCLTAVEAVSAGAQFWPDKPLRVIVAFAPGGMVDTFARTLQPRLAEGLGQPVIIENRGGAGGTLAEALVAKSAPDGYTMMLGVDSVAANPHLYRGLNYDTFKDLAPVSLLARVPLVLLVHRAVPVNSLPEFVSQVRARQGGFAYASPGTGTSNHLYMELFKSLAGIDMTHVPYKGGVPAMTDLMGGQVDAMLISVTVAAPQLSSGKVRAIAVTSEQRSPLLPQVPTFAEAGYAEFRPHTWIGLFLPAGTPAVFVQRLHAEYAKAIRTPEVVMRFRELGTEIVMNSPGEFAALLRTEHDRMGKLIQELGIIVN